MGGLGSGRHEHGTRPTDDECLVFPIFPLWRWKKKHGYWPSRQGWTQGGRKISEVGYHVEAGTADGALQLRFDYRAADEPISYTVQLTSTPCHFGGFRWWFVCPVVRCQRRCGKLYMPPGGRYFVCRVCADVAYASTREDFFSRMIRQRDKIASKLGWQRGGWGRRTKPQGMHWRTYQKLRAKHDYYETLSILAMAGRAEWLRSKVRRKAGNQ